MAYLIFFVLTAGFSLLVNGLFLKFAGTLGTKNNQDNETIIRWGSTSKPAFGGISFFIGFLLSFATYAIFYASQEIPIEFLGILTACAIGFLVGLADDAYNTKPLLKFIGQFTCAVVLILSGNVIELFDNSWINYFLTTFWVVGMMNSVNMLDNMDGITTSISIGALSLVVLSLFITNQFEHIMFWVSLGTMATLIGFLYFNWNPSRMYMGDTGSQFLGALLSALGIYFFWNGFSFNNDQTISRIITPVLAFLPSLVDTTTVTINRISRGQSPFVGGKDHTTHHLSYAGFTDRQVALVFLTLSLVSSGICVYVNFYLEHWSAITVSLCTGYCLIVFVTLFSLTKKFKGK
jgi:UDP-GlcNAc:undecaprenyl-phosphate GlcNAc-1-phosphate transferase